MLSHSVALFLAALSISKAIAWTVIGFGLIWGGINFVSTLEAAHSYYERRGLIARWFGRIILSRWFSVAIFITGICVLFCLERGIPSWIWDRDLRISVLRYSFNKDTNELICRAQLTNNGSMRRTVTGVIFTVHSKTEKDRKLLVNSWEESFGGENPIYVEPSQPLFTTFKQKIDESIMDVPGSIFGLQVQSVDSNGRSNYVDVDVMEIVKHDAVGLGRLTRRVENVSLDTPWTNSKVKGKSLSLSSLWVIGPTGLIILLVVGAVFGGKKASKVQNPPPQAVFIALDRLKTLFREGESMETAFQIPELPNPTMHAIQEWMERVNTCARQNNLKAAGVGPPDLKKLNQLWDQKDVRRIQSLLEKYGFLEAGVDDIEHLAFRTIWGHVKRLEELIGKIEGTIAEPLPAEKPPTLLLPKLPIHIAIDALTESIDEGEELKRRLREDEEPIPTAEEIKVWGDRLIELAGSCATPAERNKLRNSNKEIRFGEMFDDCIPAPQPSWPQLEEVFGKIKVARQISARLLKEGKI